MTRANVAQARDDDHDQGGTTSDVTTKPEFQAYTNRNLLNYPLARDRRCALHWESTSDCWVCDLTGDIQYRMPSGVEPDWLTAPSGFDMHVLLQILMLTRSKGRRDLRLSLPDLMRAMDLAIDSDNRHRLRCALRLWANISIHYRRWYARAKHRPHTLPPPIREIKPDGRYVAVTIDEAWQWKGYYLPVPLPSPNDATAQNLVLNLLTQRDKVVTRKWATVYRVAGLTNTERRRTLKRSLKLTKSWFEAHGGGLTYSLNPRGIRCDVTLPPSVEEHAFQANNSDCDEEGVM
jgi:hypothetical protein